MIKSNNYIKQILLLVRGMTVKLQTTAVAMNIALDKRLGVDTYVSHLPCSWIYYNNIAGIYHTVYADPTVIESHDPNAPCLSNDFIDESNVLWKQTPMYVQTVEKNETILLDKDTIGDYPQTLLALRTYGEVFQSVVANYPDQELLLRGIIDPVDQTTAISAENGTILSHNSDLIEDNTTSLIRLLEIGLKNFLQRWMIKEYVLVDNLYASTLVVKVTEYLIFKVINIHLSGIKTSEVCEFHMNEYFRSNLDIAENVRELPINIRFFLYKHLPTITDGFGEQQTLDLIKENVLEPLGIIPYALRISEIMPDYVGDNGIDLFTPTYNRPFEKLFLKHNSTTIPISLDKVLVSETSVEDKSEISHEVYLDKIRNTLRKSSGIEESTKVIYLKENRLNYLIDVDVDIRVVDTVMYFIKHIKNDNIKLYDPVKVEAVLMTPDDVLVFIVYSLLRLSNRDTNIPVSNIYIKTLLTKGFDTDAILSNLVQEFEDGTDIYRDLLSRIEDKLIALEPQHTADTIALFIDSQIQSMVDLHVFSINQENAVISANIELIRNRLLMSEQLTIETTESTIELEFQSRMRHITDIEEYNYELTLKSVLEQIAGVKIDTTDFMANIVDLVNGLTSYSTHIISDTEAIDTTTYAKTTHITDVNAVRLTETLYECGEVRPVTFAY